jgi:glycosyltransferase involved in cell wall biosynthesis
MNQKQGLLFVINDFNVGGAELFVLRLGKALMEEYNVCIMDIYPYKSDVEFKKLFKDAGFEIINRFTPVSSFREKIYWKINALFFLFGVKGMYTKLINAYQKKNLLNKLKEKNIKIIHSHYYSSDYYCATAFDNNQFKKIVTMHGDYNRNVYERMTDIDRENYFFNVKKIMKGCDALTYVADVNIAILNELNTKPRLLEKISLGYELPKLIVEQKKNDGKQFTFCMVARANATKGWNELVESFVKLNKKYPNTKLVCVAPIEGIVKELKAKYNDNSLIVFTDYSTTPGYYIQESDVCVLPTYFEGESTPYSIIEYLAYGKPVITTNAGEIQNMLTHEGTLAGILLDAEQLRKGQYDKLIDAMGELMIDKKLYCKYSDTASLAFKKFSMQECKSKYWELYAAVLNN